MTNYSEFFRAVWLEVQYQRLRAAEGYGAEREFGGWLRGHFGRRFAWVSRATF